MQHRVTLSSALVALALFAGACDGAEPPSDANAREVFFDGAEIKDIVEQDPDVTFFVDVREGAINHFDQSEEAIDFSNFVFQCPSMPAPVPMEDILVFFDEQTHTADDWSIQATQTEPEDDFRRAPICPYNCICECPNPNDCIAICDD